MSHPSISALKAAIQRTLDAVWEGEKEITSILSNSIEEVSSLERSSEALLKTLLETGQKVSQLELESELIREQFAVVHRDGLYSEQDVRDINQTTDNLEASLKLWRDGKTEMERQYQDVLSQRRALQAAVNRAEIALQQFTHVAAYLNTGLASGSAEWQVPQEPSFPGLQILQSQEGEKRAFARRLYDGAMQSLASVVMQLQVSDSLLESGAQIHRIRSRVHDILGELRQVVSDLRPPVPDNLGLIPTLTRYIQQWELSNKVPVRVKFLGLECNLSLTEKITVFRGVQEGLNNILKHSCATKVELTLLYGAKFLTIRVSDNGIGLQEADWQTWLDDGKLGLVLCRQRMSLAGGTVEVLQRDPVGTELVMELPILRGEQHDIG